MSVKRRSGAITDTSDRPPDASCHLWKPFSLEFSKDSQERLYHQVCTTAWAVQDLAGHSIGLLVGPIFVYNWHSTLPVWYSALWLWISWVFAPFNVYACLKHRDSYIRYRFWSILCVRLGINLCLASWSLFLDVPNASIFEIFSILLTKSSASSLLFTSLVHRVEFRCHILLQSLAFLQALVWIPSFCKTCAEHAEIAQKFNQVGYGLDWLFSYTVLNVRPEPATYPCWIISCMFMIVVGFILPTFAVFITEVSTRSMFLQSRMSSKFHSAVYEYATAAFRVAFLGSLAAFVSAWFILSLVRGSLYE